MVPGCSWGDRKAQGQKFLIFKSTRRFQLLAKIVALGRFSQEAECASLCYQISGHPPPPPKGKTLSLGGVKDALTILLSSMVQLEGSCFRSTEEVRWFYPNAAQLATGRRLKQRARFEESLGKEGVWGWCQLNLGSPLVLKFSPNAPLSCMIRASSFGEDFRAANAEKRDAADGGSPAEARPLPRCSRVPN